MNYVDLTNKCKNGSKPKRFAPPPLPCLCARSNPLFAHCVHGPLAPREGLKSHLRPFIFHQQKPHKKLLHPVYD